MYRILVADDEKEIVRLIRIYLEAEGFEVVAACDGEAALRALDTERIDLAVVDIMMPKVDGYQVIQHIRGGRGIPVIVLSAKTSLGDKILGLELGADDYLTKPFEPLELVARVKARLRSHARVDAKETDTLSAGGVSLDLQTCVVTVDGRQTELTKTERDVLRLLLSQPKRVFTKEQIYQAGWPESDAVDDNTIRVIVSRLRDKVGAEHIKTIRGLGYRYEA